MCSFKIKNFQEEKKVINKFRDFFWVLQAYLRGKLLRQKGYQPEGNIFRVPQGGTTARRMFMLTRWWGYRPMNAEEALKAFNESLKRNDDQFRVPVARFGPDGLSVDWSGNHNAWEDSAHRGVFTRH